MTNDEVEALATRRALRTMSNLVDNLLSYDIHKHDLSGPIEKLRVANVGARALLEILGPEPKPTEVTRENT